MPTIGLSHSLAKPYHPEIVGSIRRGLRAKDFCTQAELCRTASFELYLAVKKTGHEGQNLRQKVMNISTNISPISLMIIAFDGDCLEEESDVVSYKSDTYW